MRHQQQSGEGRSDSEKEYIQIYKSDVWGFVVNSDWYFDEVDLDGVREYVFQISYDDKYSPIDDPVAVRWYTTVKKNTDKGRPTGQDSMKLHLVHVPTDRPILRASKTYRLPTWQENIERKIQKLKDRFRDLPMCPECGSVLLIMRNEAGTEFRGCSNYFNNQACTYSEDL